MTVHVVNHTHWDREWYRPMESFRARLAELVARVCAQLDAGELGRFHLDGQTITALDALEIRPDLAGRVRAHAAAGRIQVGPWHVLADNQLVSGENLIRNLLTARRVAADLGLELAPIGYCPDAFGHPADLPRVLRGFGLDTALVWRGAPPAYPRFTWRSPDGSSVTAVNQGYYEPEVLWEAASAADRLATFRDKQAGRDADGPYLLLNGGDHLAPRPLPAGLADGAARESTLAEYFAAIRGAVPADAVVDGELRYPGDWLTFVLAGTLSTRLYLKQANAATETLLESWAEPLTVRAGRGEAVGLLRHAWDLLLRNAPHDSICGCSVDEVHRENEVRFDRARQAGEHLVERALLDLGLDTRLAGEPVTDAAALVVVNPHAAPAAGPVTVDVYTAPGHTVGGLVDAAGVPVPYELVETEPTPLFCADLDILPDTRDTLRHRIAFVADPPAGGWTGYTATVVPGEAAIPDAGTSGRTVTRGDWTLTVAEDASFTLVDAASGRTLPGLGRLVDSGDAGDTYTYDPPRLDEAASPVLRDARVYDSEVASRIVARAELTVPAGLTADRTARSVERVTIPLTVTATVWAGARELDWRVEFDNTADDHRLQAHFPTDVAATSWRADTHFSLLDRPLKPALGPLPEQRGYEADAGVAPVRSLALLPGLAVLAPGLPEVQGITGERPSLAVTVLRAVGWLSRPDLRARTAGAGPQLPTPEAQCRRRISAAVGVRLADDEASVTAAAARRRAPLRAWQLRPGTPTPAPAGGLRVDGALVSAYKPAEDGTGAVLRLVNPTSAEVVATVAGVPGALVECDLAERPLGAGPMGDRVPLGPYATRSFRVGA
ncbi:glycoside hydrolase family 38 N-terminal domain-containing protein [Micromonospora siamensis]|uniref:Mannosylglycerate hydrolase n=1 Tax=Micromonospora siamensis TaxID=299152 RepID=A0A1C5IYA9_9ACTN|nr:glycosyl hydrolase-related protein [Micromonospora siamensis]SCG63001.1 mannosylglycerate hydrolase [Micromonospora siamensis]